jgi:hypothetical protein
VCAIKVNDTKGRRRKKKKVKQNSTKRETKEIETFFLTWKENT